MLPPRPFPTSDVAAAGEFDDLVDLTDRRRVLLRAVFGISVPAETADAVFEPAPAQGPVTPR